MTMPLRIQRSRRRGARLPPGAMLCTRPLRFGNPFRIGKLPCPATLALWGWKLKRPEQLIARDAAHAARLFFAALVLDPKGTAEVRAKLAGRNCACWCGLDEPCHVDILIAVANAPETGQLLLPPWLAKREPFVERFEVRDALKPKSEASP
jgi:hypothetical protein